MSKVYNHSKLQVEPASLVECPRCKGSGRKMQDVNNCDICNGHRGVWESTEGSGWTRAKYRRLENSKLW